jgi:hypothetical protein
MTFSEFRRNAKNSAIHNPSRSYGQAIMDYLYGVSPRLYHQIPDGANPTHDDSRSDAFFEFVQTNWTKI